MKRTTLLVAAALLLVASEAGAQRTPPPAAVDSVTIRIVDVELSAAVQMLSRYLDRPVLYTGVSSARVTFETPRPVL